MAKPDTLINLRQYLISQGMVRDPFVVGSLPACWIEPVEGTPAPGQGDTAVEASDPVISLFRAAGPVPRPGEGFIRQDIVTVEIYASLDTTKEGYDFEDNFRALINDRRGWVMNNLPINESLIVRDIQRVDANALGVLFNFQYQFTMWGPFQPAP